MRLESFCIHARQLIDFWRISKACGPASFLMAIALRRTHRRSQTTSQEPDEQTAHILENRFEAELIDADDRLLFHEISSVRLSTSPRCSPFCGNENSNVVNNHAKSNAADTRTLAAGCVTARVPGLQGGQPKNQFS